MHHLEAATESTLLEPNWDAIIACFDSIRGGEVPAKAAMASIRRRILHENPHVAMHALLVLDACVKNCGQRFHAEVATREFMEEFKNLGNDSKYDNVKNKVLEMLQCWAMAFANRPECKIIVDTHNLMKLAGFDFPSVKEADAMFMAQVAPEWQDGNECFRCRTTFGVLTRKHHCRACGQIFCDKCSSREMPLPQFGIEKDVRVCDACFDKTSMRAPDRRVVKVEPGVQSDVSAAEKEKMLKEKEEEDLQLALAISQSEAEAKEQEKQRNLYNLYNGGESTHQNGNDSISLSSYNPTEMGYKGTGGNVPSIAESPSEMSIAADDPLARYFNREYWQQKKEAQAVTKVEDWAQQMGAGAGASAPVATESSANTVVNATPPPRLDTIVLTGAVVDEDKDTSADDTTAWCNNIREQVSVMENRIRSNGARGRALVNDTAIADLFAKLTELHMQVLSRMNKLDDERTYFESLQDHLTHIGDSRSAVNELREEHERKMQERMAEEQRVRQAQMKQTLAMMRMKKHTMILEQREQALARFQQQEQEAQARRSMVQQMPPQAMAQMPPQAMAQMPIHQPYFPYSQPPVSYMNAAPTSYASMPPASYAPPTHPQQQYVMNAPPHMDPNSYAYSNANTSMPQQMPYHPQHPTIPQQTMMHGAEQQIAHHVAPQPAQNPVPVAPVNEAPLISFD